MTYRPEVTNRCKKDLKLAKKQKRPFRKLEAVLKMLCEHEELPPHNRDHALTGNFRGCRECHIEPDWLLIYVINDIDQVIELIRIGSHSELFK